MGRVFDRKLTLVIGALGVFLAFTAGFTYQNVRTLDDHARWVAHTHEVLDALSDLSGTLRDAQAGQRGYLLTGDRAFLKPYSDSVGDHQAKLARVRTLTADNPRQQARVPRLAELVAAHYALLARTVAMAARGDAEGARGVVRSAEGKRVMDAIRSLIADMEAEENRLLAGREAVRDRASTTAIAGGVVAAVIGLGAVGLVLWVGGRHLEDRGRESAARYEQEFLRAAVGSMGDGVVVTDTAGRVRTLNRVAEELTQWTQGEAAGRPLEDVFRLVNAATRLPVANPVRQALAETRVVGLAADTVLIARDGTEWPLDDSAAPIRGGSGRVAGAVMVFREVSERRLAEQALAAANRHRDELLDAVRSSEDRFRAFMDNSPAMAYMKDADGRFVYVNQPLVRQFPDAAGAWVGKTDHDLFPAAFADEFRRHDRRVLAGDAAVVVPETTPGPGGTVTHWRSYKFPFTGPSGERLLAGMSVDVTAEKLAEDALRESEHRLRTVVDNLAEGVVLLDRQSRAVLRTNAAFLDLLGYAEAEALALTQYDFVAHDRADVDAKMAEIVARGRHPLGFRKYRRKDGTLVDVTVSGSHLWLGGRDVLCLVVQDMTPAKAAEDSLRASEEKFRAVVDRLAEGVFLVDAATMTVVQANGTFLDLVGHTPGQAAGLTLYDVLVLDRAGVDAEVASVVRDGRSKLGRRQVRRRDGSAADVDVSVSLVPAGGRQLLAVVLRDMTEQREYEDRLADYQQELEGANARLRAAAVTDPLTGAGNRAAFDARLGEEFGRAARHGHPLSVLMVGVDRRGTPNDAVLRAVADTLRDTVRPADFVARHGGDEFAVVLPDTDLAGAVVLADRCRRAVGGRAWGEDGVTASVGVGTLTAETADATTLAREAEDALRRAKAAGRDQVKHGSGTVLASATARA